MEHRIVNLRDCLLTATPREKMRLSMISDMKLLRTLAQNWCDFNGYKLGGYLGNEKWDATKGE